MTYKHTVYAAYLGYITQAIINNLAPLLFLTFMAEFHISLQKITLLVTVNFLIQLAIDFLSAKYADKLGYRACIVSAHILCATGLVSMAILPYILPSSFFALLISVVIYALGGGLIEVLISPIVEACPSDDKSSAMSLLHSFYCWGCVAVVLCSTVFLRVAGRGFWPLLAVLWAILPLFNAFLFSKVPIARLTDSDTSKSLKELFSSRLFICLFLLMLAAGASEQSMSQWASAFCESGLHVSKTVGDILGVCLFSVFMGFSRVLHAKFGSKYSIKKCLCASALLCVVCYAVTALSPFPLLSLAGCALTGFSVGILWPGTFSLAASACPSGGTAMFAILALAGDLGCAGGPTLVGFVSGAFDSNLKAGLLAAIIFPVILIFFSRFIKEQTD